MAATTSSLLRKGCHDTVICLQNTQAVQCSDQRRVCPRNGRAIFAVTTSSLHAQESSRTVSFNIQRQCKNQAEVDEGREDRRQGCQNNRCLERFLSQTLQRKEGQVMYVITLSCEENTGGILVQKVIALMAVFAQCCENNEDQPLIGIVIRA